MLLGLVPFLFRFNLSFISVSVGLWNVPGFSFHLSCSLQLKRSIAIYLVRLMDYNIIILSILIQ